MTTIEPFICSCGHTMALHSSSGLHPCRKCDCSQFHSRAEYTSVYVIVALDDGDKIGECVVVKSIEAAQLLYKHFRKAWRNVALISRTLDDIPNDVLAEL